MNPTKFLWTFVSLIWPILPEFFNKLAQNECEKNLSYQTMLIKSYKYVPKMSKLQIFVITNICNKIFVTFGRIGTRSNLTKTKPSQILSQKWSNWLLRKLFIHSISPNQKQIWIPSNIRFSLKSLLRKITPLTLL
jgi:hypothetical protein